MITYAVIFLLFVSSITTLILSFTGNNRIIPYQEYITSGVIIVLIISAIWLSFRDAQRIRNGM